MNEHIELLVAVKPKRIIEAAKIALWVVTILFVLMSLMGILGAFPFLIAIATGIGAYFVGPHANIEYEYSLTDKEIDVDVIYAKQKRKNVTTIDLTKLEIMAPMGSYRLDGYANRQCKVEDYSSNMEEHKKEMYVMYCDGSRKIIIEPDERLYKAIYSVAPHKVYNA